MSRPRQPLIRSPRLHQALSIVLLMSLVCALLPLPMVGTSRPLKDLSEAFPCQHHTCGCRTAQQCWKSCCCFTNEQKVEWARRTKHAVPEFVVVAAAKERVQHKPSASCCSKHRHGSNCDRSHVGVARDEAKSTNNSAQLMLQTESESSPGNDAPLPNDRRSRVVIGWQALKCQGLESQFASGGLLAVCPTFELPVFEQNSERVESLEVRLSSRRVMPPEPPPRA